MPQGQRRGFGREPRGAGREVLLTDKAPGSEDPRAVLHGLSLSLARNPDIAAFSRALVERVPAHDRLARLTACFSFVSHLVDAPLRHGRGACGGQAPAPKDGIRDGVDWLLALAGEEEGPSVILAALLLALGERAAVRYRPGLTFVRVELDASDVARLPPHASLLQRRGRLFILLDARSARAPFAFLPGLAQRALALA